MANKRETMTLESTKSIQISLETIRSGDAGLNAHRQMMLGRTPETGDWARFALNSLELIDLAYLSAKTGHEFAILRGHPFPWRSWILQFCRSFGGYAKGSSVGAYWALASRGT